MRPAARLVGLAATLLSTQGALACGASPGTDAAVAQIARVEPNGDLAMREGATARAPGVRIWPGTAADALLAGRRVALAAQADRWGRLALADPAPALALLSAGLAFAVPEEAEAGCAGAFLAAEDGARRASRGGWADRSRLPADAARGEAVAARAGEYLIMQGRIAHVGWTRRAAYLNFGRPGEGASAELPGPVRRALERQGWTQGAMRGQNVRVRGVVAAGRTARVLVESAEAVEWLR